MQTPKATLLFVDDEARILRTLDMSFRNQYRVICATDGNAALQLLKTESVDVIISDQRMPNITGVEVLRFAREISPNSIRILLTGYSELAGIVGSINEGEIFRYVQKPWRLQELRETIEEAVVIARSTRLHNLITPAQQQNDIIVLHGKRGMAKVIQQEKPDFRVHYASTLEQALSLMEKVPNAILVTDLVLPEGDISEGLSLLKSNRPELVVIVVTAFTDTSHLIKLINRAQVYRVLPMPLSRKMLFNSIDSALRHQQLLRHRPEITRRYKVEKNTDPIQTHGIVDRVRGYLDRIRTAGKIA